MNRRAAIMERTRHVGGHIMGLEPGRYHRGGMYMTLIQCATGHGGLGPIGVCCSANWTRREKRCNEAHPTLARCVNVSPAKDG